MVGPVVVDLAVVGPAMVCAAMVKVLSKFFSKKFDPKFGQKFASKFI